MLNFVAEKATLTWAIGPILTYFMIIQIGGRGRAFTHCFVIFVRASRPIPPKLSIFACTNESGNLPPGLPEKV